MPSGDRALAAKVVATLMEQNYVSGLLVDDDLGPLPGTLPLSAIKLKGTALTPFPAIVVNFGSFDTGCDQPLMCAISLADTRLQHGQGTHRAGTMNFMAAFGPDFRPGFADDAPVGNADLGKTIAHMLGLKIPFRGQLLGSVIGEALPGGEMPGIRLGRSECSRSLHPACDLAQEYVVSNSSTRTSKLAHAGRAPGTQVAAS
jgi:hypothetical protein